jgi:hypothetical protein
MAQNKRSKGKKGETSDGMKLFPEYSGQLTSSLSGGERRRWHHCDMGKEDFSFTLFFHPRLPRIVMVRVEFSSLET